MGSVFGRQKFSMISLGPSDAMQRGPLTRTQTLAKRACDVALAVAALFLLSPLMAMTALAIKLSGTGPVIDRQRRTGFDGRKFFAYKFRTTLETDDGARIPQTRRDDPRLTKIGRMLRQSSIDELPQFFNVLRGDMSLVGPSPHADNDDQYLATISTHARGRGLKPGITGWADVSGLPGEPQTLADREKRAQLELWYIDNWSLSLDLRIMRRICFQLMHASAH
jgi:lipopolysaccharide/colanic/teichoic acid biosynthesis glycosyltransferase